MAEAKQFEDQQRPDLSGRAYGREPATSDLELVQVGPGTAGGELLRRYWQPFALAREATSEPKHIKILDECLVLFRNGDGEPGLLYPRCMHRGTDLIYGKVESNGIRCCYHGWLFAPQGQCLEIPTETNERLRTNIRQPWYPVVEKYGLLFTYMGPPEREPLFPTFSIEDQLEPGQTLQGWRSDGGPNGPHPKVSAASDYNWWQMYDNWMDPFHVCILHSTINGPQFSPNLAILPEVTFETTRDGVISIQKRRLPDGSLQQRISQVMAPNLNCTAGISDDDLGPAGVSWTVPTDDRGYILFGLSLRDSNGGNMSDFGDIPMLREGWGPDHGKPFMEWSLADHQRWQTDYVAQKGQGDISLHSEEHLMAGDKGTALSRRFFREQAQRVARGENPVGTDASTPYRYEMLAGNAKLDPDTLECIAGYAARV